jgi:hypothetical protein
MAEATLLPDLGVGFAEEMTRAFETRPVQQLTAEEVSGAIFVCAFLRNLFGMVRRSIEAGLQAGVEAKAFASKYEKAAAALEPIEATVRQAVERARAGKLPVLTQEFLASYEALGDDMASLRAFVVEAVAKAKIPARAIDWERVEAVRAAYERGETRPFQRSSEEQAVD